METRQTGINSDETRWRAVCNRDGSSDGAFVFAVLTTGVYCRPSCPSRRARRENVRFFDTPAMAEAAGYRACKRCRPDRSGRAPHRDAIIAACETLRDAETEPALAALAKRAGLSPGHFQRVFKSAVGLSPKQFAKAVRAARFRDGLRHAPGIADALYAAGYAAASRAYADLSGGGMAPAAHRKGGAGETIRWAAAGTGLGGIVAAATARGICLVEFTDGQPPASLLVARFPKAEIIRDAGDLSGQLACAVAAIDDPGSANDIPLDMRGTAFQERVWRALTRIPPGRTVTYSELARILGKPAAARAVASACAKNRIAGLIPCHRVVREDGTLAGYRWGIERKKALIGLESGSP